MAQLAHISVGACSDVIYRIEKEKGCPTNFVDNPYRLEVV
jgi:hypothetical protein